MRSYKFLFILVTIFTFSITGVNAQNFTDKSARSTKTIEQQINNKLINLTHYGVFDNISFQVADGMVTLDGKVNSIAVKDEAERTVSRISGVTKVVNNIEQLPPSPYDDAIRRQALVTFMEKGPAWHVAGPRPDVRIIVENGRLTLEGRVSNLGSSNMLNILANGIPGVFSVQNNLVIGKEASM